MIEESVFGESIELPLLASIALVRKKFSRSLKNGNAAQENLRRSSNGQHDSSKKKQHYPVSTRWSALNIAFMLRCFVNAISFQ
jgi:hypothetical protein